MTFLVRWPRSFSSLRPMSRSTFRILFTFGSVLYHKLASDSHFQLALDSQFQLAINSQPQLAPVRAEELLLPVRAESLACMPDITLGALGSTQSTFVVGHP